MTSSPAAYTVVDPVTGIKIRKRAGTRFRIPLHDNHTGFPSPTQGRSLANEAAGRPRSGCTSRRSNRFRRDPAGASKWTPQTTHTLLPASFRHRTRFLMLHLADQFARTGRPQVIFDPKPLSDHSAAVLASGGRVASLDELIHADGVLDPLRFAQTPNWGWRRRRTCC